MQKGEKQTQYFPLISKMSGTEASQYKQNEFTVKQGSF